ncbi:MAG: hypothetical protein BGO68_05235 [Candidatus Amoebophilus sp. 36-38]|nr:MAG: hypothetical protein BGO68_05235 [Candidatus Amoebophilus sp. 36-38]
MYNYYWTKYKQVFHIQKNPTKLNFTSPICFHRLLLKSGIEFSRQERIGKKPELWYQERLPALQWTVRKGSWHHTY